MFRKGILVSIVLAIILLLGACGGPGVPPDRPDNGAVADTAATLQEHTAVKPPSPPAAPERGAPPKPETAPVASPVAPETTPAPKPPAPVATPGPAVAGNTPGGTPADPVADTCTLAVTCGTILANRGDLNPDKKELVPADGVILPARSVAFQPGENVFDILRREMKRARIHFEFVSTPMYDSAYIRGIHNLYEGDCGPLSGWTYKVNGRLPNYGISQCLPQSGDVVEIVYSCDLGRDVEGNAVP